MIVARVPTEVLVLVRRGRDLDEPRGVLFDRSRTEGLVELLDILLRQPMSSVQGTHERVPPVLLFLGTVSLPPETQRFPDEAEHVPDVVDGDRFVMTGIHHHGRMVVEVLDHLAHHTYGPVLELGLIVPLEDEVLPYEDAVLVASVVELIVLDMSVDADTVHVGLPEKLEVAIVEGRALAHPLCRDVVGAAHEEGLAVKVPTAVLALFELTYTYVASIAVGYAPTIDDGNLVVVEIGVAHVPGPPFLGPVHGHVDHGLVLALLDIDGLFDLVRLALEVLWSETYTDGRLSVPIGLYRYRDRHISATFPDRRGELDVAEDIVARTLDYDVAPDTAGVGVPTPEWIEPAGPAVPLVQHALDVLLACDVGEERLFWRVNAHGQGVLVLDDVGNVIGELVEVALVRTELFAVEGHVGLIVDALENEMIAGPVLTFGHIETVTEPYGPGVVKAFAVPVGGDLHGVPSIVIETLAGVPA